jgi:HNH endonuclease
MIPERSRLDVRPGLIVDRLALPASILHYERMRRPSHERQPPNDCLYCRRTDVPFKRVEHPIPESLGNDDLIIPRGWVCDPCNQYFGAKLEAKVLSLPPFSIERAAFSVRSKKWRLAHHQDDGFALAATGYGGQLAIIDEGNTLAARRVARDGVYIPRLPRDYDDLIARFLLKVGLSVILMTGLDTFGRQFDLARRCARYGERARDWDVAYGAYPKRKDIHLARRWDGLGPVDTHQLYQYSAGTMDGGDVMFCFIFATTIMAINLSRPAATEYILKFNARNEFAINSRWRR